MTRQACQPGQDSRNRIAMTRQAWQNSSMAALHRCRPRASISSRALIICSGSRTVGTKQPGLGEESQDRTALTGWYRDDLSPYITSPFVSSPYNTSPDLISRRVYVPVLGCAVIFASKRNEAKRKRNFFASMRKKGLFSLVLHRCET
jgi:hypothetical protein